MGMWFNPCEKMHLNHTRYVSPSRRSLYRLYYHTTPRVRTIAFEYDLHRLRGEQSAFEIVIGEGGECGINLDKGFKMRKVCVNFRCSRNLGRTQVFNSFNAGDFSRGLCQVNVTVKGRYSQTQANPPQA